MFLYREQDEHRQMISRSEDFSDEQGTSSLRVLTAIILRLVGMGLAKEEIFYIAFVTQCSTNDKQVLSYLKELPFFSPIIENELHVLRTCSLYEDLRHNLSDDAKNSIFSTSNLEGAFKDVHVLREITMFLTKAHERRFSLPVCV
ncbi:hypothetical protein ACHWQZ_G000628 [Mnemiopsis leidyi]